MMRAMALAVTVLGIALCVSCAKAESVDIPAPDAFDLNAAAEVRDQGNGLWLLEGATAASHVIDATYVASSGSMTASVLEMMPVDEGASVAGRSIDITSVTDGVNVQASIAVGDQVGEFVAIGDSVWLRGNEQFAIAVGLSTQLTADLQDDGDGFVCVKRHNIQIEPFMQLAMPAEFARTTLNGLEMSTPLIATDGSDTQTIVLGTGGAPTGQLDVALHGAPLPRHLFVADESGTVQAEFNWGQNEPVVSPDVDATCV